MCNEKRVLYSDKLRDILHQTLQVPSALLNNLVSFGNLFWLCNP